MARWEPDAPGRLAEAALDLFAERGFDQTTVEDIATRAGVTKRTFFRHYADKREVLFDRNGEFERLFLAGAEAAPADASPFATVAAALDAVGAFFADRREFARRRARVVAANTELQERELAKLSRVTVALAQVLRERGVGEPTAGVTAEMAIAVFRNAFDRWVHADDGPELAELVRESLDALRAAVAS